MKTLNYYLTNNKKLDNNLTNFNKFQKKKQKKIGEKLQFGHDNPNKIFCLIIRIKPVKGKTL